MENFADEFSEAVRDGVDAVIPFVEAVGAIIIVTGVVVAAALYVASELRLRPVPYEHIRLTLGRFILLGIEFQLAADILTTAVSPTFEDIGMLAAIAAIRTVLNYFLSKEIEKAEEMEGRGMLPSSADLPAPAKARGTT